MCVAAIEVKVLCQPTGTIPEQFLISLTDVAQVIDNHKGFNVLPFLVVPFNIHHFVIHTFSQTVLYYCQRHITHMNSHISHKCSEGYRTLIWKKIIL